MIYDILAVNPGSTSTKIAVFRNREEMFRQDIEHDPGFLDSHPDIEEQFPFRLYKCPYRAQTFYGY